MAGPGLGPGRRGVTGGDDVAAGSPLDSWPAPGDAYTWGRGERDAPDERGPRLPLALSDLFIVVAAGKARLFESFTRQRPVRSGVSLVLLVL